MEGANCILDRMTEYFDMKGSPVVVQRVNKGYSIIHETGEPVARFWPRVGDSNRVEVLWWSHSDKWDHIGDFGGLFMDLDEALEYVISDPMGIFWKGKNLPHIKRLHADWRQAEVARFAWQAVRRRPVRRTVLHKGEK
jgi:hypothetical protein